jgi:hypothetical protein
MQECDVYGPRDPDANTICILRIRLNEFGSRNPVKKGLTSETSPPKGLFFTSRTNWVNYKKKQWLYFKKF